MSEIIKIGLVGKMRSGKDTVADYLYFEHGFEFPKSFGSALKYYAHRIFPWVAEEPKPRALYQFMNVMREFDEDVWVKHLAKSVEIAENDRRTTGIVVTDARQENEVEWLRENGFIIVKVEASDDVRRQRIERKGDAFDPESFEHSTELYVDQVEADYVIENNGDDIDELKAKVDDIMANLYSKGDR